MSNTEKVPMYKGKQIPDRFAGGYACVLEPENAPPIDKWALIAARKRELQAEAEAEARQRDAVQRSAPAAS